jgi:predicted dehydrogenase
MMGRRHLKGLVRAGYLVLGCDPSAASVQAAKDELSRAGLPAESLRAVEQTPAENFDLAVFAETAAHRFGNVSRFAQASRARRVLLEKPLSADPQEVDAFVGLFGGLGDAVQVNFARRAWPMVAKLRALCEASSCFDMTVNGGAFGFGCNGIHYLDLFLFLSGVRSAKVALSRLSGIPVASGRGAGFQDFGGRFVVETPRSALMCAGEAESSAPVAVTIRGAHFAAWIDERDFRWRLAVRDPASRMPNYRYGADYRVEADEQSDVPAPEVVTERWARGELQMPSLEDALASHRLLDEVLRTGGATPPYRYT